MKRILLFAVLSIVIFEADARGAFFMAVAALLAAGVAARLPARPGDEATPAGTTTAFHPLRAFTFAPWFLGESLRGGLDVAWRAFRGRAALRPGFIDYRMRLRAPAARILFMNSVSLMPGSFTARVDGDVLRVHALDTAAGLQARLHALERRLLSMFGEDEDGGAP